MSKTESKQFPALKTDSGRSEPQVQVRREPDTSSVLDLEPAVVRESAVLDIIHEYDVSMPGGMTYMGFAQPRVAQYYVLPGK
jgi:hypothetical protein